MTRTHHLFINVKGVLTNWPKSKLKRMFIDDETGKFLSADECKAHLLELLSEGKEVIPLGKPCEGFDYQTGCPGHDNF